MKGTYLAAGAVVAVFVSLLATSNYANSSLQFRSRGVEGLDFARSSADIAMDVCNPTPFPAGFDRLEFVAIYRDSEFATMEFEDGSLAPNSLATATGTLDINGRAALAAVFQSFADILNGRETGDDEMRVRMISDSRLLGFVPASQSREMSGDEFSRLMSGESGFDCTVLD